MIISITDQLSIEALQRFNEKINSIPLNEINELTLNFIRGFSRKAIDRLILPYKIKCHSNQGNLFLHIFCSEEKKSINFKTNVK